MTCTLKDAEGKRHEPPGERVRKNHIKAHVGVKSTSCNQAGNGEIMIDKTKSQRHQEYDVQALLKGRESGSDEEIDSNEDVMDDERVSNTGAFWNVCNSIQGVAILAMPYVVKTGGWWSLVSVCVIAAISSYTGQILLDSKYDYVKSKGGDLVKKKARESYADIGEAVSKRFGRPLVLIMQVLELEFMATLYPIIAGSVLKVFFPNSSMAGWILIFGILLVPNVFIEKLKHISLVSAVTIVTSVVVFVLILSYCFMHHFAWDTDLLKSIPKKDYPLAAGVITASYSSQMYLPVIEKNMQQPQKINTIMNWAYTAMTALKIVIGTVGYLTFQDQTQQVISANIPSGWINTVINVGVLVLSLSSYSLPIYSVFDIIDKESQWLKIRKKNDDKEYRLLLYCFRILLYLATILMAEVIPHFTLLLSVIGSVTGVCLEFVFPCVFHIILHFDVLPKRIIFLNVSIVMASVILVPFAVYFTGSALIIAFHNHSTDNWI